MYEEEYVLKIFYKVWVILFIESEIEIKSVNLFKVMVKIVLKLKCEYYIFLSLVIEKFFKKKKVVGNILDVGFLNFYEVWKKFFDLDF